MQALWMVLAAFFFASMGVGVKLAATEFTISEIVCYRGLIGMVLMALAMRARGTSFATAVPWMHTWRALIGLFSLITWFYAIAHLPLATAMTLNYMSGVWVAAFVVGAALVSRKSENAKPPFALIVTVLCGFAGVVMALRPTIEQNQLWAGVVGLLSGVGTALAYLQVKTLGRVGEPEDRTVFYFGFATAVGGAAGMLIQGVSPAAAWHSTAAWWLLPIGILATLGQWCMTRAYSQGATLVVASLQYTGIVFASIYGLMLFDETIPFLGWAGIFLIVASGLAATVLRARSP